MEVNCLAHNINEKIRTRDVILDEDVNFKTLLLNNTVLNGLSKNGFLKPSPIQLKAIPLGRCGFDLIVKSKSGTGKTLVFSVIALEIVKTERNQLQSLMLVPTREIAEQIVGVIKSIGTAFEGLKVESFIGGMPVEDDIKKAKNCHIAVGTPGRVKHLLSQKHLNPEFIRLFVLDEADKLMEESWQKDINDIYAFLPQRKQIIASSATFPKELDSFLTKYMLSPTHVSSEIETPILLGLKQFVTIAKISNANVARLMQTKNDMLLKILSNVPFTQCLIFSNFQTRAEGVSSVLNSKGWTSDFINATQSQPKRLEVINSLKGFKNRILLSTDLTARGIDAPNVDLVINYDIPHDTVTYLHRMGRAGRYGTSGVCISMACAGEELKRLQHILGDIGASNLTISVLPELNASIDLCNIDPKSLEQVNAIVLPKSDKEKIKDEIMMLKSEKNKTISKKLQTKKNKNKKDTNITNDLAEVEPMNEAEELFASLLEDGKKRKRDKNAKTISPELPEEKRKTFCKNVALMNTAGILAGSECEDAIDTINRYLNVFKNEDEDLSETVEDLLNDCKIQEETTKYPKWTSVPPKTEEIKPMSGCMENIFRYAYDKAIDKEGAEHLSDILPNEIIEGFQNYLSEEAAKESESDIQFNESLYDEEECGDEYHEYVENFEDAHRQGTEMEQEQLNESSNGPDLQWMPVVQSKFEEPNQRYQQYFNECSRQLWQNGLTFESVPDFDAWFNQWQEHLTSVRNYVQQNIYVEEMSQYQQEKFYH